MTPFVPHGAYVLRLAARADAALGSVEGVWPGGIPVELRDRAGLFHTARHVAYCARMAAPDNEEMRLYMSLVAGLPERYGVPDWRARRTIDRIAEWVREAEHAEYVERKAQVASWHASMVFNCARHEVRLAATQVLTERGRTAAEIVAHLGCTDRQVRRLLEASGAPREKRPPMDRRGDRGAAQRDAPPRCEIRARRMLRDCEDSRTKSEDGAHLLETTETTAGAGRHVSAHGRGEPEGGVKRGYIGHDPSSARRRRPVSGGVRGPVLRCRYQALLAVGGDVRCTHGCHGVWGVADCGQRTIHRNRTRKHTGHCIRAQARRPGHRSAPRVPNAVRLADARAERGAPVGMPFSATAAACCSAAATDGYAAFGHPTPRGT